MKYCIKCGAQLDDTAKFCNACGHQIDAPVHPHSPLPASEQAKLISQVVIGLIDDLIGLIFFLWGLFTYSEDTSGLFGYAIIFGVSLMIAGSISIYTAIYRANKIANESSNPDKNSSSATITLEDPPATGIIEQAVILEKISETTKDITIFHLILEDSVTKERFQCRIADPKLFSITVGDTGKATFSTGAYLANKFGEFLIDFQKSPAINQ